MTGLSPRPPRRAATRADRRRGGRGRGGVVHLARERADPQALDVKAREDALHRECAALAAELARVAGHVPVRGVHARAIRVLGAAQGTLSIRALEDKRRWLQRCLRMGRLL